MRRGCQLVLFGRPQGPIRDNLEGAQADAERLKLGRFDEYGSFYLDAGACFRWAPITPAPSVASVPVRSPSKQLDQQC